MTNSVRLRLPLLSPAQMAKESTHNEALARLDVLVAAAATEVGRNDPPTSPQPGDCFVVGAAPAGAWIGHAQALACFTTSGWLFVEAVAGMSVLDRSKGCAAHFDGVAWTAGEVRATELTIEGLRVVGSRQPAIPSPSGGTTADSEARAAIDAVLAALRTHGLIAS
jgi:hypothetical protein